MSRVGFGAEEKDKMHFITTEMCFVLEYKSKKKRQKTRQNMKSEYFFWKTMLE